MEVTLLLKVRIRATNPVFGNHVILTGTKFLCLTHHRNQTFSSFCWLKADAKSGKNARPQSFPDKNDGYTAANSK